MVQRVVGAGLVVGCAVACGWGLADVAKDAPPTGDGTPSSPEVVAELTAKPELVAEHQGVAPGGTTTVAVVWTIKPGWHMYWDGQNDTGLPPSVKWELPAGASIGPLQWPAPERHVAPGDILDYVHHGKLVLLASLTAPLTAKPGETVAVRARLSWQVCEELCILEDAEVELKLPVVAADAKVPVSASALVIERARTLLPKPITKGAPLKVEREGLVVTITTTEPSATGLAFFPRSGSKEVGGAWLKDGLSAGETTGKSLTLGFDLSPLGREFDAAARGVVEVRSHGKDGSKAVVEHWLLDVPLK